MQSPEVNYKQKYASLLSPDELMVLANMKLTNCLFLFFLIRKDYGGQDYEDRID